MISRGDIRNTLNLSFSEYTQRFVHTEKRTKGLYTTLWIKNADLQKWRSARGVAALRQYIGEVFAEEDGRRLFPDIYQRADEIKERRRLASNEKNPRRHHKEKK